LNKLTAQRWEVALSFSTDDFAKALEQHDYQFQRGQTVRGKVDSYDSNGVYVDIGGKSAAFLPMDEVSLKAFAALEDVVPLQQEREFLIIREQDVDGQVTLSIRQLELRQVWENFQEMLEQGKTIQARVSGVNKGGVTVDVQGLRGFIPRSHLIQKSDLEALVGKGLTVAFLEVNSSSRKLVLSERLASQAASMGKLEIGQLVNAKIVGMRPFGLFLEFEGTTGLLHINQISKNYISSLESHFEIGQPLSALVIDIDDIKRRISLSTKVLENYPGEILDNREELMATVESRAEKARTALFQKGVEE
jgi:small subunit ribosomal protein S1